MPYLRYVSVRDGRTRPEHAAWHGTVLPVRHPFWRTHHPPNGWHCRCTVVQLSENDLGRRGYDVSPDPEVRTRPWHNARTLETMQVPLGIDPGFGHNAGLLDLGVDGHAMLRRKAVSAGTPGAADGLDDYIARGRAARSAIVRGLGSPESADFDAAFRARLRRRLADERGAGTVDADVVPQSRADVGAADRLRAAARDLPASWVSAGNARGAVRAQYDSRLGSYTPRTRVARIPTAHAPGTDVHEYCHHLQYAMPQLQRLFTEDHIRRTTRRGVRDPVARLPGYPASAVGRRDDYVDPYAGRTYDDDDPLEAITRHVEMLFHSHAGHDWVGQMVRDDPGMVDLLLGGCTSRLWDEGHFRAARRCQKSPNRSLTM